MSSKTVIISGANGYFGSIACQYFKKQGWQVLKGTRQQDADIKIDLDAVDDLVKQTVSTPVDLFIHAAAAHEVTCRENPYTSICQNIVGTKAALDFCLSNNIPKFVYLSTFHVFGHPSGTIDESVQPLPANDYGLSHLQAEEYVQMYNRESKIQGTVIRPSNFFGIPANLKKFNRWTLVPVSFCQEAVLNKQIILKTPGTQKRNFIGVNDICATLEKLFFLQENIPLIHLTGNDNLSIKELAQLVCQIMKTHFDKEIELTIPEGVQASDDFSYESKFLSQIHQPIEEIEDFLIEFCRLLKQQS
ncbi:MAG: NAD(P)-dependent oxidoreductase [Gloeocapsa sp. DLM2.Bin57]|nr:MAG: NAD(P)-dependent oxidoreductase [Gloeocapsa sp. DLM2.Bin57]